jgi:hypothetical protein
MYKIYIVNTPYVKDRILIYDDDVYDESLRLSDPKLHLEVNSAGTLEFSIAPDNVGYDKLVPMKTQFIVMRSDSPEKNGTRQRNEIIWFGRALTIDTDIYKVKSIHCEGGLSYLNDVVYRDNSEGTFWNATQPVGVMLYSTWNDIQDNVHHKLRSYDVSGYVYAHTTEGSFELPKAPLRIPGVVFEANDQYKTKYWGLEPIISNDQETQNFFFDQASLSQTNYASTSGILNPDDMTALDLVTGLLDATGGYYWVSLVETDAPNGLDRIYGMQLHLARTLKEPNENYQSQTIRFGENLTDYTENEDGSSFWTAVHPYGTFEGKDRSSTLTKNQLGSKGTTPIKKLNWHVESAADNYPSIIIVDDLAKEYGIIVKDLDAGTLSMSEQLIGKSINAIDSLNIVERKSGSNSWTSALRDVTITGVDMTFMGADYNMIDLMDSVHIISEPHGVDTYLNVTSIDVDLQRPENSVYVLNGTLERNMAESNGYSGSSSGSSSGSGGGYTHPRYTEHALDLYKVANDSLGHVSSVDKVTKEDLFALGVPSRNTTYDLTKKDGKIILRSDLGNEYPVNDDDTKYTLSKTGDTIKMEGTDGSVSEVEVSGGTDTTYSLSKTGDKITLIGSDGSSSSVVDSDTTYAFVQYATLHTDYASHPPSVVLRDSAGEHTEIIVPNAGTCVMGWNPLYNKGYGDLQNTDKYASIGDILFAKSDDWVSGSCDIHAHFYMKYDTLQYGFDIYIWTTPGGFNRAEIFVPSVLSPQNIKWTVLYTVPGVNEGFEKRSVVYRICVDQESMKKIQDVNGSVFIDYQTGFKGGALEPVTKTNAVDAYLKKYHYDSVVRTDVILSSQNASDVAFTGDYNDLSNKPTIPDISSKQDKSTAVTHSANTAVGSATKPVYVAANGVATPISHSINSDVPANAKFTDTTYNDATQSTHGLMTAADKKKLDGMDLTKITNSALWVNGANNAAKWVRLGTLVSSGNFSNGVIRVWTGDGANGRPNQNSSFEIQIKDGWQSTLTAVKACGVTVYRINCSGVKVKVIPTAHDTYTVWTYLPWAYWNGNYAVYGIYKSWTSQKLIQSYEPEGTAADTAYYDQAFLTSTVAKATEATTLTDSGWVTCPLAATGNTTYPSSSSVIKVRKYGKLVRLEASVSYKTAFGTVHEVATIPEGYRPSMLQRAHGIMSTATEKIWFDALLLNTGSLSFIPAGSNSSTFNPSNSYQCDMTYFID